MQPRILTVPMNPEFLPETVLILASLISLVVAIRYLLARDPRRALSISAAGVACMALALWMGKSGCIHAMNQRSVERTSNPIVLVPASSGGDTDTTSVSLVLGGVLLRVAPADSYAFSVGNEAFLALDSLRMGLRVSCNAAGAEQGIVRIGNNALVYADDVQPTLPDANTILFRERNEDILRIHYANRHKIEVEGEFYPFSQRYARPRDTASGLVEPAPVSFKEGIRWQGGGVAYGTSIDLTPQGKGRIDFTSSGLIQIRPDESTTSPRTRSRRGAR